MKEVTNILGQLSVAHKKNKKFVGIQCKTKITLQVLDLLWSSGIIYGYAHSKSHNLSCYVYLKYSSSGNPLLNYTLIKNKRLRGKDLFNLKYLEPNVIYLVWTEIGCVLSNDCLRLGKGGILVAKLN